MYQFSFSFVKKLFILLYLYPILITFTFCFLSAKYPSEKRNDKWKTLYSWLQISDEWKSLQNLFFAERQNLFNAKFQFYLYSCRYKFSDHDASRCHNQAVWAKEHKEAVAAGSSIPSRKVVQHASSNSSIEQGIQIMSDLYSTYEWTDTVKKLHEIVYCTALKGQPF